MVIVERLIELYTLKWLILLFYELLKWRSTSDVQIFDIDPTITRIEQVPIIASHYENDTETLQQLIELAASEDDE